MQKVTYNDPAALAALAQKAGQATEKVRQARNKEQMAVLQMETAARKQAELENRQFQIQLAQKEQQWRMEQEVKARQEEIAWEFEKLKFNSMKSFERMQMELDAKHQVKVAEQIKKDQETVQTLARIRNNDEFTEADKKKAAEMVLAERDGYLKSMQEVYGTEKDNYLKSLDNQSKSAQGVGGQKQSFDQYLATAMALSGLAKQQQSGAPSIPTQPLTDKPEAAPAPPAYVPGRSYKVIAPDGRTRVIKTKSDYDLAVSRNLTIQPTQELTPDSTWTEVMDRVFGGKGEYRPMKEDVLEGNLL